MSGPSEASRDVSSGAPGRAPLFGRPWARAVAAWAPWLGCSAALTMNVLWWTQRAWPLRFAAVCALASWSAFWCWRSVPPGLETRFRLPLTAAALVPVVLGLQGVIFGLAGVPVVLSGWVSSLGALLLAVAAAGGPLARAKALTACIATLLALGGLEIGTRVLRIGETARESDTLEIASRFNNLTPPRSAFVNKPKPLDEFPPVAVEINAVGIRGPEVATGPVDMLLIGDSFIEARQLPWEHTLGPRLQAVLRARSSAARVVSHGMRGWSPLLEWNWYLKVGRRFHADRVLLFFFWNDLWSAGSEASTFRAVLGPDGRPDHFDVRLDSDWLWYRHVRTVRLIEEAVRLISARSVRWAIPTNPFGNVARGSSVLDEEGARSLARRTASGAPLSESAVSALLTQPLDSLNGELRREVKGGFWPGIRPMKIWSREQLQAADQTEHELARFAQDVSADGGRLVIVYVPNPYQIDKAECSVGRYLDRLDANVVLPPDSGVQAWLRTVSVRHGIELLDPTAAMRTVDPDSTGRGRAPLYLRADCHWSVRGHQFMADWLADWYLSGGGASK